MLKLKNTPINPGLRIVLPEDWHEKLVKLSIVPYPYEYIVTGYVEGFEPYYICMAGDSKIALTECCIRYLTADEVPDSNMGFSLDEYLPVENTQILVTLNRNPSEVIPCTMIIEVQSTQIVNESLLAFTFYLDYLNGNGITNIRYYTFGPSKSTWKFLLLEDETYMTDYEKMFKDTYIHKRYVLKSCNILAQYLENKGATYHATELRKRAKVHDESKVSCVDELMALSRIINDKTSLKDANRQLSIIKKDAIKLHWKHNSHHPEHYASPIDMSRLDIMEMCCDWHARSTQFHTNFLEYVKKNQENRFHFPEWMFKEIWHYCEVLNSAP